MSENQVAATGDPDFDNLMQRGWAALERGYPEQAHALWRRAAIVNPYNEQVWIALLEVVETPEDQQACLKNILEINPTNTEARRRLRGRETQEVPSVKRKHTLSVPNAPRKAARPQARRITLRRALLLSAGICIIGCAIGVVLSIIIYGL